MLLHNTKTYVLLSLLCISIILSIVNLIQFCVFYSHRKNETHEMLQRRNPMIVIVYALLSMFNSFIILPTIIFTHILAEQLVPFYLTPYITSSTPMGEIFVSNIEILQFVHEVLTCLLLLIIAQRAWILFYDYKHIDAYTATEWKDIIIPNESKQNKWLKYRNTCGSHTYLAKILLVVFIVIVSGLFVLQNIFNIHHIWIVVDGIIAFPLCIFILCISYKMRNINDRFKVGKELQYLSIIILIIVFSFAVLLFEMTLNIGQKHSRLLDANIITFIADILFFYFTVHIQCHWVMKQSFIEKETSLQNKPKFIRSCSRTTKMIDVLQSEFGFKAFINHCVKEVNAENLLFLVEIAQYKATLLKYNVGEQSIAHKLLKGGENLHKIVLEANTPDLSPYTVCTANANRSESNLSRLTSALERLRSGSGAGKQQEDDDEQERDLFRGLHENILSQTWLPCARQLRPEKRKLFVTVNVGVTNLTKSTSEPDEAYTPHLRVSGATSSKVNYNVPSRSRSLSPSRSSNPDSEETGPPAPPSLQLIQRDSEYEDDEDPTINKEEIPAGSRSSSLLKQRKKYEKESTVSNEWIFLYSMYLFKKYIARYSDLTVNLPYSTRSQLINLFSMNMDDVFDNIWNLDNNQELSTEQSKQLMSEKSKFKNILIKTYLYHVFDESWRNIWTLLRDDTFRRFQSTDKYIEIMQLQNKRNKPKSSPKVTPRSSPKVTPKSSPVLSATNTPRSSRWRNYSRSGTPRDSPVPNMTPITPKTPKIPPPQRVLRLAPRSSSTMVLKARPSTVLSEPINENEVYVEMEHATQMKFSEVEDVDELVIMVNYDVIS